MVNTDLAHAIKSSTLSQSVSLFSTQWDGKSVEMSTVSSPNLLQVSVCGSCDAAAVRTRWYVE